MAKLEHALVGGWRLSIIVGVFSIGFFIAAVVGLVGANWSLAGFGAAMTAFFGWAAWSISPVRPPKPDRERAARRDFVNRMFSRLGITWAVDPEWRKRNH
jgi:hypothetical protein